MSVSASPALHKNKVYSTLFYLKAFKNHPEDSMTADLVHPSLGKVLDTL